MNRKYLVFVFCLILSTSGRALDNPFAKIPTEGAEEARLKIFQKIYGQPTPPNCVRGKPDRWIDDGHPEVAKAIFHPMSTLSSVEIVRLKNGDQFEILNYGCESLSAAVRYLGPPDKTSKKDLRHWFKRAANDVATLHHLLDRQKGSPFDLDRDSKTLEAAADDKKSKLAFGTELGVDGDGLDFQQARISVLDVEQLADKRSAIVILLNRGPL